MSKVSERKAGKHASAKRRFFFLLFIGEKMKDHVLKARYIKILDSYTNLGDHKHLLQFYWKFAAFLYISKLKQQFIMPSPQVENQKADVRNSTGSSLQKATGKLWNHLSNGW